MSVRCVWCVCVCVCRYLSDFVETSGPVPSGVLPPCRLLLLSGLSLDTAAGARSRAGGLLLLLLLLLPLLGRVPAVRSGRASRSEVKRRHRRRRGDRRPIRPRKMAHARREEAERCNTERGKREKLTHAVRVWLCC